MVIPKDESEFEVTIRATDDAEWEGRIIEYNISRLLPTLHLCHSWSSLDAAIAGVTRRWQRLFPGEEAPDFDEAVTEGCPPTDAC
jgi:hypothetical protein